MSKVCVSAFTVSLDGFGAGPEQTRTEPLGKGGEALHEWLVGTRTFHAMTRKSGGSEGTDDGFARRAMENVGAWIMGRNMFGPIRGPWPDETWKGWWGNEPPYHVPTFVLTHHPRASVEMQGGTTFHFVTEGAERALSLAREAAGARDIRIGGGVSTVRQYLEGGRIDELHIAIAPILLGRGEALLSGIDLLALGYRVTEHVPTEKATHVVLAR